MSLMESCASTSFSNRVDVELDDPAESRNRALREEAAKLQMRPADLDVFLRAGFQVEDVPKGVQNRRSMLEYLKKRETAPPRWVLISGLWPDLERTDTAEVRRKKIRALHRATVLLIRRELKRHESDAFRSERTIFWNPVADVCRELEIAQSTLSGYCKELTGNSLIQTIDAIRAESVKGELRRAIRAFVAEMRKNGGLNGESGAQGASFGTETEAWEVWKALKLSRRWPDFSQNGWAAGLGFASYRRMYRACQVVYGMTPHQLEMTLIRECLKSGEGEGSGADEPGATNQRGMSLAEIEVAVREIRAFEQME